SRAENDILPTDKYGDWLSEVEGWKKSLPEVTSTGFYYYMIEITAKIAKILGRADDTEQYETLAGRVKEAFNRRFFNPAGHCYEDGSQFTNGFPLFLGLVPAEERAAVLANLVDDIVNKQGGHLTTGIFGLKYVMELLSREGSGDVAWLLATQDTYPSWLHMLKGRTTLTEKWTVEGTGWSGSVDSWFYKELGGIKVDEDAPGYGRVNVKPFMPAGLPWAKVMLKTVKGEFRSEWAQSPEGIELKVRIPVGVEAMVHVRADTPKQVSEGGLPAEKAEGVTFIKMDAGHAVFQVLSGDYAFVSNPSSTVWRGTKSKDPLLMRVCGLTAASESKM
ncbi:MAG: alpha-L-rhamnosidase C-terminal domain-containing protein, partial [Terrimicrobiaceae bacterium]